jgi:hypothetical protein
MYTPDIADANFQTPPGQLSFPEQHSKAGLQVSPQPLDPDWRYTR